MKKILSLLALVMLSCMGAWAEGNLQASTSETALEHIYKLRPRNENGKYWLKASTGSTQSMAMAGTFAFIKAEGDNNYYIFDVWKNQYLTYGTPDNGANKLSFTSDKNAAKHFYFDYGTSGGEKWGDGTGYLIRAYNNGSLTNFCMNWHGGPGTNNYPTTGVIGFYNGMRNDAGCTWVLEEVVNNAVLVRPTYVADSDNDAGTNEGAKKLVDAAGAASGSKWGVGYTTGTTKWITVQANNTVLKGFKIFNGNDTEGQAGRRWKNFSIEGSNDNSSWTAIKSFENCDFDKTNYGENSFTIAENTASYSYYKITITANQGATMIQMSDLLLAVEKEGSVIPDKDKVYSIKNSYHNNTYACDVHNSGTNYLGASTSLTSDGYFFMEGNWQDGYQIRIAKTGEYVYAIGTGSSNDQVGIKALEDGETGYENKYRWSVVNVSESKFYIVPRTGDLTWSNNAWNRRGGTNNNRISLWEGDATDKMAQATNLWVVSDLEINIDDVQNKINDALSHKGQIGYPVSMSSIESYGESGVTKANLLSAYDALTSVYNDENINLPEDGHAYVLTAIAADATRTKHNLYESASGNKIKWSDYSNLASDGNKAKFICRKVGDRFMFVNAATGHYLIWRGTGSYSTNTTGYTETYSENNKFTVKRAVYNTNTSYVSDQADLFGWVCIGGYRDATHTSVCFVYSTNGATENFQQDSSDDVHRFGNGHSSMFAIEEVDFPYTTKTLNDGGDGKNYATVALPYAMEIPADVKAYAAVAEGDVLTLTDVTESSQNVPAGAYILVSESKTSADVLPAAANPTTTVTSELLGSITTAPSGDIYVLNKDEDGVGFFKFNGNYNTLLGKAYLPSSAKANKLSFRFEDVVTAISAIEGNSKNVEIFDLQGRRLEKTQKGMNIINGHKVLVK